MRNFKIKFEIKKINFLIYLSIFSFLFSSIPRWVSDVTDDRFWVGVGIVDNANSSPGTDPSMIAFLKAVEQIAAQISVSISSSTTYEQTEEIEIDSDGNLSGSASSSFEGKLKSKVEASLKNVKVSKRAESDGVFYCLVKLDKKKYFKDLAKRRDEGVAKAKEILEKVIISDFDGTMLSYLDNALSNIIEFQYGIDNDFISMNPPMLIIKDCPESGSKLESTTTEYKKKYDDESVSDKKQPDKIKASTDVLPDKFDVVRKRADELLNEMRTRIDGYNKSPNISTKKNENDSKAVAEISEDEDDCKKCLKNASCSNPFSEECECAEICGVAIQNELCDEKEILLVEHINFLLDDYIKRINFSGPEDDLNLKFGTQHERLTFRITDSFLDKMGFKSLNDLIKEREEVIYKSSEWSRIQNLINQLLDSNKRYDEGIVSLPLYNIPIVVSIGNDYNDSTLSDKNGYFNVDFPKYVAGAVAFLQITLDMNIFNSYLPLSFPNIKIPISIEPLSIFLEVNENNEWNDNLGYDLKPIVINKFSNVNFIFTETRSEADRYIVINSESILNEMDNSLFKSNHSVSLSFSDDLGVIYEDSFKNKKNVNGIGSTNIKLRNIAEKSKKKITSKFKKELDKIYSSIMNK